MAAAAAAVRHVSASSTSVSLAIVLAAVAITCSSFPPSSAAAKAASCSSQTFSGTGGGQQHPYASCADLPRLGATLHYNYTAATNTVAVAFRAPQAKGDDGWVAWGINPSGRTGMVGTQAVVAFQHSNGSLVAYPTVLDSYVPSMAPAAPGDLAFPVSDVAAEYADGKQMVVYATLALPAGKGSKFTQVWQQGTAVVNDVPAAHPTTGDNILSTATIDFSD
ncbi:auxin-induced in root cultures protein 12-like [Miscanthus floridulus]|uniref:auxin-induced in root cultures protein 12-like n=1 Tax=Miscanthus floridulus TaxID=154761 RepID=UPI003459D052